MWPKQRGHGDFNSTARAGVIPNRRDQRLSVSHPKDTEIHNLMSSNVLNVLADTPMESNGQGWGAWSSLVEMCQS